MFFCLFPPFPIAAHDSRRLFRVLEPDPSKQLAALCPGGMLKGEGRPGGSVAEELPTPLCGARGKRPGRRVGRSSFTLCLAQRQHPAIARLLGTAGCLDYEPINLSSLDRWVRNAGLWLRLSALPRTLFVGSSSTAASQHS